MNLVADASTLIAELLRARGRELFRRSALRILVTHEQWAETERGLSGRAAALRRGIPEEEVLALLGAAPGLTDTRAITVVPRDLRRLGDDRLRLRNQHRGTGIDPRIVLHGTR